MNYKKASIFFIILNIILSFIYFAYLAKRASFNGQDNIIKSFKEMDDDLKMKNEKRKAETIEALYRIPKMQKPYIVLFSEHETIVGEFSYLLDSLLKQNKISDIDLENTYKKYNVAIEKFQYWYEKTLHDIQDRAKFTDNEINEKIKNFDNNAISGVQFQEIDIESLNQAEKKLLLLGMKMHIRTTQTISNNDFSSMFSTRRPTFPNQYPLVMASDHSIKKGKNFNAKIAVGMFLRYPTDNYYSVYLNGEKLKIENSREVFHLDATTLGKHEYECIVTWMHPQSKEQGIDTSYFNYTVID